jgi:ferredoxin
MPIIKFVKEKKEVEVPVGANLRDEAIKAGINLNTGVNGFGASINKYANCKGLGLCGTCRVNIVKGMENLNPLTFKEKVKFKYIGLPPDPIPMMAYIGNEDKMRLACMCKVNGDIEVESTPQFNLFGENFFS